MLNLHPTQSKDISWLPNQLKNHENPAATDPEIGNAIVEDKVDYGFKKWALYYKTIFKHEKQLRVKKETLCKTTLAICN